MKHLLLALLDDGPAYGLELKQQYDELVGLIAGPINVGQIYTTLNRLEATGLVQHRVEPSEVGPDRKVHELTEDGAKELRVWLESPPAGLELKSDALMRIVAALHLGRFDVGTLIRDHRRTCLEALRALDGAVEGAPPGPALDALAQAAALHLQAELHWLDHVEQIVSRTGTPR